MSEALENKLKSLNDLNNLRKELKAKTIDRRLTELNLFDRTSKLFAPIINVVEKQNENLEVLKNNLINQQKTLPSSDDNQQRTLPSTELFKSIKDHSMFIPIEESNGEIFFKLKNRDAPQLKFNPSKPNELTIFPNDGSQEIKIKINEGTKTLLFDIHPNTSIITGEDFNEYLKIYKALGDKPGEGNRIKNIINTKSNKDALNLLLNNFNKTKPIKQTNLPTLGKGLVDSNEKIMKRLGVLSSAYKAGHTNVLKEMTAILDDLLERKIINKRQYQEFIN